MLSLMNYGSSSETDSDTENADKPTDSENNEEEPPSTAAVVIIPQKPIESASGTFKVSSMAIQAAPEVVPSVSILFLLKQ